MIDPSELKCYNCKERIVSHHSFYSEMCVHCGDINFHKRNQKADLNGYTALVTGGRIKIGYETCLKLLRSGAKVIVTSRFPNDTGIRYSAEKDFENWKDRLFIYGLDMRQIEAVNSFISLLRKKFFSIDIIINNAAQTVRRPPHYYKHLLENEQNDDAVASIRKLFISKDQIDNKPFTAKTLSPINGLSPQSFSTNLDSAMLSQIPLLEGDEMLKPEFFPDSKLDKDGQQIDRRPVNSWMLELEKVEPIEFMEVLYINLFAPFLFNSQLKDCLVDSDKPAFIINVSAMEGNFADPEKNCRHPHTNMAKAALNMMTRTSSESYAEEGIYMNSVDVGYITNEKPYPLDMRSSERKDRMAIDEIDGAARILDPIFKAMNNNKFEFGKLYKNYKIYQW